MTTSSTLYSWIAKLTAAKIHFTIATFRENAIMLQVSVPGERWEVEFLEDGSIEVERFRSTGKIEGPSALDELLAAHSS